MSILGTRSWASSAEIVRAVLFAKATATTFRRAALSQLELPFRGRLAVGERRTGTVDQQGAQRGIPTLLGCRACADLSVGDILSCHTANRREIVSISVAARPPAAAARAASR